MRGVADDDVVRFSGVPYAAPPTGDRRWTAPRPPRPWPGVRDATAPTTSCPQVGYDENFDPIPVGDEDCLYVDVVAPARPRHDGRLPVVVWLHGGNLASGGAAEFDGARLASGGDVVVVTVNYRLGALGFLSAGAFDVEGTTSRQLRSARPGRGAALGAPQRRSVRWRPAQGDTGRAVSGRPQRLHAPRLARLAPTVRAGDRAERCLCQPGDGQGGRRPQGGRGDPHPGLCGRRRRKPQVAECLRAKPLSDLVFEARRGQRLPVSAVRRADPWGPVAGTPYLPRAADRAIRRGSAAGVRLLVGSTHDEMREDDPGTRCRP